METINGDKLLKMCKEMYPKFGEPLGYKFDEYLFMIQKQIEMYNVMPDEDKVKFLKNQQMVVNRWHKEIVKELQRRTQ